MHHTAFPPRHDPSRRLESPLSPLEPENDFARFRAPRTTSPYTRTFDAHKIHLQRHGQFSPRIPVSPLTPRAVLHTVEPPPDFVNNYRYSAHNRETSKESGWSSLSHNSQGETDTSKDGTLFPDEPELFVKPIKISSEVKSDLTSANQPWIISADDPTFFENPDGPQEDVFELGVPVEETVPELGRASLARPLSPPPLSTHRSRRSSLPMLSDDAASAIKQPLTGLARSHISTTEAPQNRVLQVDIPHYRIGRPRFSERGTVYLQSIYTLNSLAPSPTKSIKPQIRLRESRLSFKTPSPTNRPTRLTLTPATTIPESKILEDGITSSIYDVFLTDSENPNYIIFTSSGQLLAATEARLIVQITHDQFLDYNMLSDFFLTFRSFMKPAVLLDFLVARLRWAFLEPVHGRIVRVRTFVALRHWILNYFLDDFEPSFQLRSQFCDLINCLVAELRERRDGGAGDLQVIGELQKAWRRTCDIVWGSERSDPGSQDTMLPGGPPLGRTVKSDFLSAPARHPDDDVPLAMEKGPGNSPRVSLDSQVDSASPRASMHVLHGGVRSTSYHATSCSLPLWQRILTTPKSITARRSTNKHRSSRTQISPRSVRFGPRRVSSQRQRQGRLSRSSIVSSHALDRFQNGALIRGTMLAPRMSGEQRSSRALSMNIDQSEALHWRGKKVFSSSHHRISEKIPDNNEARHAAWPSRTSKRSHTAKRRTRRQATDLLTDMAARTYTELRLEAKRSKSIIPEELTPPPTRSGAAETSGGKTHSRMTAGSQSIVIVDDTEDMFMPMPMPNPMPMPVSRSSHDKLSLRTTKGQDEPEALGRFAFPDTAVLTVEPATPTPKTLRRIPAGELKSATRVQDLDHRRNSTGSIILGQADDHPYNSLTLNEAKQSLKDGRPSFQQQAARLASIDDVADPEDDGGVESTLAKLEGTSVSSRSPTPPGTSHSAKRRALSGLATQPEVKGLNLLIPEASSPTDEDVELTLVVPDSSEELFSPASSRFGALSDPHRVSGETLEASKYWPMNKSDSSSSQYRDSAPKPAKSEQELSFLLMPDEADGEEQDEITEELTFLKPADNKHSASSIKPTHSKTVSVSSVAQSFFLEADESDYEDDDQPRTPTEQACLVSPLTPLNQQWAARQSFRFAPPRTPPPASPLPIPPSSHSHLAQLAKSSALNGSASSAVAQQTEPQISVSSPLSQVENARDEISRSSDAKDTPHLRNGSDATMLTALTGSQASALGGSATRHTPFILSYSTDVLARHFTIIEQDALTEVHWNELVNMQWTVKPASFTNWAAYLLMPAQSGIDLVIARFNLVVKWAVSQVVMTTDTGERARTITKFIDIAVAARKLGNFATCYQLTIAMLSPAIVRLTRTWSAVDAETCQALADLEQLVQPGSDYAKLRGEMESRPQRGSVAPADGHASACVPFIGIYTHDLSVNANKPAKFDPLEEDGEPMINFERFQTSARIVKEVLKLLEASSVYHFKGDRELVSKCLWLSALDDDEIARRSIGLCFV